jgi:hypothetical protein
MSDTQYETYNAGDDGYISLYGATWGSQMFTVGTVGPSVHHKITSVKLYLDAQTVTIAYDTTISIRETSAAKPFGSDLCSGVIPASTITTTAAWYEVSMSPSTIILQPGTVYAIVLRCPGTSSLNSVWWRCDGSSPSYTGGAVCISTNSGVDWSGDASKDLMFYEYGIEVHSIEHYIRSTMYGNEMTERK